MAQTWTWPPATTAPSIVAVVPAVGTVLRALEATVPPGSAVVMLELGPERWEATIELVFDWPWAEIQSAWSDAGLDSAHRTLSAQSALSSAGL